MDTGLSQQHKPTAGERNNLDHLDVIAAMLLLSLYAAEQGLVSNWPVSGINIRDTLLNSPCCPTSVLTSEHVFKIEKTT